MPHSEQSANPELRRFHVRNADRKMKVKLSAHTYRRVATVHLSGSCTCSPLGSVLRVEGLAFRQMSELTSCTLTHTRMRNMRGTSTKDAVLMFWQEHKCLLDVSLTPISCTTPQRKRGSSYRRDRETRKCIIAHSLFLIHLGKQSVSSRQGTSSSPQTYKAIKLAAFNFFVQSSLHWLIYFFSPLHLQDCLLDMFVVPKLK